MEYTVTLKYRLSDQDDDLDGLVERLGEVGCDDAVVGIGQTGRLSLEFIREAESVEAAVRTALEDLKCAIPKAKFLEATAALLD